MSSDCDHDWKLIDSMPPVPEKDPCGYIALFCCPKCEEFKEVVRDE